MQNKNLVLFLVLSLGIIFGWQMWTAPKPRPRPPTPANGEASKPGQRLDARSEALARVATASALASGGGIDQALQAILAVSQFSPVPEVAKPDVSVNGSLAQEQFHAHPPREAEEIDLGDSSYFLKVRVSSKGASVRKVTLNKFQAADELGLPMWENGDKNTPMPLDLVPPGRVAKRRNNQIEYFPEEPFFHFQLYHYANAGDEHPVETLGDIVWTVQKKSVEPGAEQQEAVFTADLSSLEIPAKARAPIRITKTFSLARGDYHLGLSVKVESLLKPVKKDSKDEPLKFRYQLAGAHGLPIEGEWYTYTYRNALFGWVDKGGSPWRHLEDLRQVAQWLGGEPQPRADKRLQYAGVAIQYFASVIAVDDDQPNKDFLDWARATLEVSMMKGKILSKGLNSFVLTSDNRDYPFHLAPAPELQEKLARHKEGTNITVVWSTQHDQFLALDVLDDSQGYPYLIDDVTTRVVSRPIELMPGDAVEQRYVLYHGPVKVQLLDDFTGDNKVNPDLVQRYRSNLALSTLTDWQSPGWAGNFASTIRLTDLIIFCTNLLHKVLWGLHQFLPLGLCILVLTLLVRGMMYPISRRQALSTQQMQEKMAKLAPEVKKLQEKYKDDMTALNQARTELYLRHGINPVAQLGGCLLLFVQMPIFLGLYYCLQESIHFRLAPFLWIRNLAAPDMLVWWGEHIPFLSEPSGLGGMFYLGPYFNLLPVIAVSLMLVQQKMLTPPPQDEQQAMQMKMMKYMMVFMGLMFYKVAAGLCIYFIASSLWGLAERKLLPKTKPATGNLEDNQGPPEPPGKKNDQPIRKGRAQDRNEKEGNGTFDKVKDWWKEVLKQAEKNPQAEKGPSLRRDKRGKMKRRRGDED